MSTDALPWVWPTYYAISGYWILSGLISILNGFGIPGDGKMNVIALIVGGVTVLLGIGLVAKIEFVRGLVNVGSFLKILGGLLGAWGWFLAIGLLGPVAALMLVLCLVDVITGALMIFLLGETDSTVRH